MGKKGFEALSSQTSVVKAGRAEVELVVELVAFVDMVSEWVGY